MAPLLQELFLQKEASELEHVRKAAGFACFSQQKLIQEIEKIIDEGLKQSHSQISAQLERLI